MFKSARIKLTAWYLIIITLISVSFSVAMYKVLTSELNRIERLHTLRIEHRLPDPSRDIPLPDTPAETQPFFRLDPNVIKETKNRLILILALIDLTILISSAVAGYFLAGRTLKPIKEMLDEQKRFVTDASHELRTPLTSIKTEVEVALRDKKLTLKNAKTLLKSNLEEAEKMQKLSNYLLSLSRLEENEKNLKVITLDIKEVVEKAIKKLSFAINDKNITLIKELKSIQFQGNEISLTELTSILLDNAIKYSPKNGKVIIRTKKIGKNVILEVQDFGQGINASEISHIFDRFYRADSSRSKEKIDGYGLGLAIAKNIVDVYQGKIEVKSEPGKGSTFKVTF